MSQGWMNKKIYFTIYCISVLCYAVLALIQKTPGYMDAQYYYAGAIQLAEGRGWTEPYLWNYMNSSGQLPVHSFLYWMPFTSILSAISIAIFHSTDYFVARLPFILLAALIPVMTAYWVTKFNPERKFIILGAAVALLSGYYLPFITHTDTFVPFFVLGSGFFILTAKMWQQEPGKKRRFYLPLFLGLIAGCMHLTRADGILWISAAFLVILVKKVFVKKNGFPAEYTAIHFLCDAFLILTGYLLVMGGWFGRNIGLFGSLFPPDNGRNLWLTQYNDLFYYPASRIDVQHWLSLGWKSIVENRFQALSLNLQSLLAVMGGIVLFPFMILGFIKQRSSGILKLCLVLLGLEFILMSIVFPFAGGRGGFFHSGSAFQIILWSMVPIGFSTAIDFGVKKRGWKPGRAWIMFGTALLCGYAIVTMIAFSNKVQGFTNTDQGWDEQEKQYTLLVKELTRLGVSRSAPIMIGNPPGYYLASNQMAVVIPEGGVEAVLAAAEKYHVEYLVIDQDHPASLDGLFSLTEDFPQFELIEMFESYKIYRISH